MHLKEEKPTLKNVAWQLGLRLRTARVEAGLTQALLAARAGVSVRVVSRMERGDETVSLGRWLKVSRALKLLESWQSVFEIQEDPFARYDRKQKQSTDPSRRRVRPKKRS